MPLLDHFHPPLVEVRRWESFHARWAVELADRFEQDGLPEGYIAEVQTHVSGRVEVDVAVFEQALPFVRTENGGVATATRPQAVAVWAPPEPDLHLPSVSPDVFEVLVYHNEGGLRLVGAVEFVSPGNKDRDDARRAFAVKCANYLYDGVGLVIVDIVTSRRSNLHNELIELMRLGPESFMPRDPPLYAAAYRPVRRNAGATTQVWLTSLSLGGSLPILPLSIRDDLYIPVDLESTYDALCRRLRLV